MNNPIQAMLWELWRTSRAELIIRVSAPSALIVLLWLFCDLDELQWQVIRGIIVMLLVLTSVFSLTWLGEFDSRQSGFSFRLGFTRPATTTMLVVVPMLFLVATAVATFLIPAVLFRLLLSSAFPLAGPAAWVAGLTCCLVAVTWSAATRVGKRIAIIFAACAAVLALVAFHARLRDPDPFLLAMGKPRYFELAWHQYATLLAAGVLATAITIKAVDRQRHDVPGPMIRFGGRTSPRRPGKRLPESFSRPLAAQCWYEMRRFGHAILLQSIVAALLIFGALSVVPLLNPRFDPDGMPVAWLFALVVCPFAYQLIGADGAIGLRGNQGATCLSPFDATRPMPSDHLIAIKLLIIAACSLFGFLCMAAAAALHAYLAGDGQAWARIGDNLSHAVGDVPAHWWIVGACNTVLFYISSTSAFLAFGLWLPLHRRFFVWGMAAVYLHIVLVAWDASHQWSLRPYWMAYGYLLAVAIVAVCLLALHKAVAAGSLGRRFLCVMLTIWMIHVGSTVTLMARVQPPTPIPLVAILLGGALLLVPLATTAAAPLALAAHRHG